MASYAETRRHVLAKLSPEADHEALLWGVAYLAIRGEAQQAALDLLTASGAERRDWALVERVMEGLERRFADEIAAVHAELMRQLHAIQTAPDYPKAREAVVTALQEEFIRGQPPAPPS